MTAKRIRTFQITCPYQVVEKLRAKGYLSSYDLIEEAVDFRRSDTGDMLRCHLFEFDAFPDSTSLIVLRELGAEEVDCRHLFYKVKLVPAVGDLINKVCGNCGEILETVDKYEEERYRQGIRMIRFKERISGKKLLLENIGRE
jgi:hypothetical protein